MKGSWQRVGRWEASGLSAAAFATRERIEAKRLVWWRWKLRSTPPAGSAAVIDFLPVRVLDAQPARPSPAGPIAAHDEIVAAYDRFVVAHDEYVVGHDEYVAVHEYPFRATRPRWPSTCARI
ncbi:IS66 family insertion sequence element accessory protein TnpA [Sorangium sp. So ce394]|uniref:IS66 family insertion sequence element accessory protein TnpA n=1 Tax=Sorangium sp. So ce394 TaxID=3133310 RepID=UPI003F5CB137